MSQSDPNVRRPGNTGHASSTGGISWAGREAELRARCARTHRAQICGRHGYAASVVVDSGGTQYEAAGCCCGMRTC